MGCVLEARPSNSGWSERDTYCQEPDGQSVASSEPEVLRCLREGEIEKEGGRGRGRNRERGGEGEGEIEKEGGRGRGRNRERGREREREK